MLGTVVVFALIAFAMVLSNRRQEAKEPIVAPAPLGDPLTPASYSGIALFCTVEYLVEGERRTAKGRVLLSSRLDRAGTEPLLYPATGHGKVVFLAGLPQEARADASGQWQPVDTSRRPLAVIVTAVIAGAAHAGFAWYVPWLLTVWRLQPA